MAKQLDNIGDFYSHLQDSTFLKNVNKGVSIPDPNKMANGMFFNTGQMQYNKQEQQFTKPNRVYADSVENQSYGMSSVKNYLGGNK